MARHEDFDQIPLTEVELGDVVMLPDGRALTARIKVDLPGPVGSMSSFVVCGEMEILLSVPATPNAPFNIYVPVDYFPGSLEHAQTRYEGAASYWAPHLPGITGAMAEVLYRVVEVRGSVDPVVIIYRGAEFIVFIRTSYAFGSDLKVLHMPRSDANDYDVVRHAGIVDAPVAVPQQEPRHLPTPAKTKPRRRLPSRLP